MSDEFEGKVAVVTGGTRGIGRAIAASLVQAGAAVTVTGRKVEAGEAAAEEIGASFCAGNAGTPEDIDRCVDQVVTEHGRIDVLVNNAATNPYAGPVIDIDAPRWQKILDVNVTGPLLFTQAVWNRSMKEHGGAILNISSVGAFHTNPFIGAYDISKSALVHLSKQMAAELAPKVRVNVICPGLVKTDFAKFLWEDGKGEKIGKQYPMQRIGEPEDIAGAAMYLLGDASAWVTGQTIVVDGGGEVGFSALASE